MKTLCVYVCDKLYYNWDFFSKYGMDTGEDVVHSTVYNFTEAISLLQSTSNYDNYLIITSVLRGPFVPSNSTNWHLIFTNNLSDSIHIVSISKELLISRSFICFDATIKDQLLVNLKTTTDSYQEFSNQSLLLFQNLSNPYDTIFATDPSIGDPWQHQSLVDEITLGRESIPIPSNDFDWICYVLNYPDLWKAGIRTEKAALEHYKHYGRQEGRTAAANIMPGCYYNLDINIYGSHGLYNQLNVLVNAIIMGHYTGRNISVDTFYPSYNSRDITIDINEAVDVSRLNLLITELGLNCRVVTTGQQYNAKPSKYKNWIVTKPYLDVLYNLRYEGWHSIDIGNTFSFTFQNSPVSKLRKIYKELTCRFPFSRKLQQVANSIIEDLNLSNYGAVHLRLEDDIVEVLDVRQSHNPDYIMTLYNRYLKGLKSLYRPDKKIFIATGLKKGDHEMNWALEEIMTQYPNAVVAFDWRTKYSLPAGREIEAIIDYLICRQADSFIGYKISTFSYVLLMDAVRKGIPFYDCNIEGDNQINDVYKILTYNIAESNVGYDMTIGIGRQLGHPTTIDGTATRQVITDEDIIDSISAHGPSTVKVNFYENVSIRGYCSITSANPPTMKFMCDGEPIGTVGEKGAMTDRFNVSKGIHHLTVTVNTMNWAHSVWLIYKQI